MGDETGRGRRGGRGEGEGNTRGQRGVRGEGSRERKEAEVMGKEEEEGGGRSNEEGPGRKEVESNRMQEDGKGLDGAGHAQ